MTFTIYHPPEPGLPFLAVIINEDGATVMAQAVASPDHGWRLMDHLAERLADRAPPTGPSG